MIFLSLVTIVFPHFISNALVARNETVPMCVEYLMSIAWFYPIFGFAVLMNFFLRIDGRPIYAFWGLLSTTFANILLDYIFVAHLNLGLSGAALATGLAFVTGMIVVFPHFLWQIGSIKFIQPTGSWHEIPRLSLIHISEPTRQAEISYAVFCLKKKKKKEKKKKKN